MFLLWRMGKNCDARHKTENRAQAVSSVRIRTLQKESPYHKADTNQLVINQHERLDLATDKNSTANLSWSMMTLSWSTELAILKGFCR